MTDPSACPRCGARIPASRVAGDFGGACPQCLLREAAQAIGDRAGGRPLPPGTRIRDFETKDLLGQGGMGSVYKARQLSLGRDVALKILLPRHAASADFISRFEREARLLAGLSHPNLVHVYDFGREGEFTFLSMEYVEGRPLKLPVADSPAFLRAIRDVALALQKVHDAGMVHRDVKPSNILVAADGTPKLGDFGIVVEPGKDDRLTETGVFVGSPHYASPEHIEGRALDGRSDLYALGVILFEGLAGHPPFTAPSSAALLARHLHEAPPLRDLDGKASPRLRSLVESLLSKDPAGRPAKASDVAAELDRAIGESPAPSRRGLLIGAGVAAAAAIAATVGLAFRKGPPPSPPPVPVPQPPTPKPARVDLLDLVHPERDTIGGKWTREDSAFRVAPGRRSNRIQVPYEVPDEYDLTARVERIGGLDSFHLGLSSGGRNWSLMIDTGLAGPGASGLHFLDGKNGAENETTRVGRLLQAGSPVDIDVRVRRGHVVATVAGKPLVDWTGDFNRLSLATSAFRVPSLKAIFLGAEMDEFVVHRLTLAPVSQPGRPMSVPPKLPADPKAPIDLLPLIALDRDVIWGLWSRKGSVLSCSGGARAHRLQLPYEVPEEYDLKVLARRGSEFNSFHVGLSSDGRPFAVLFDAGGPSKGRSGLHHLDGRSGWENPTTVTKPILPAGVTVEIEIAVRKGRIVVKAGGEPVLDWSGQPTSFGADPNFRIPNPRIPWFGVEVDTFEILGAVLTPVTGTGRALP